MGLINSFVEHDGLKAIIVANEREITEDERGDYYKKKEKLVGKTIEIRSHPDVVLEHQLNNLKPETVDLVRSNKAAFLRTFNACRTPSFRIMRAVLHDFDHLINSVDKRLRAAHTVAGNLLNHMLAIELECRGEGVPYEEIIRIGTFDYYFDKSNSNNGDRPTEQTLLLSEIEKRYEDVDWSAPVLPTKVLVKFTQSGVLELAEINESIAQNPHLSDPIGIPAWRRLWYYPTLSESEYLDARQEVLSLLKSHSIIDFGQILHIAGLIIKFSEYGDHFIKECNIVDYFNNYIQSTRDIRRASFNPDFSYSDWISYGDLGFASRDHEDFEKILDIIRDEIEIEALNFFKEKADTIVSSLFEYPTKRNLLYESDFGNEKYGHYAFLQFADPEVLAEKLIRNGVLDRDMMNCLKRRYEHDRGRWRLFDEHVWIERLKLAMEDRSASLRNPHRAIVKDLCEYHFEQIERLIREAVGVQMLRNQERADDGSMSEAIVEAVRSERDGR